MLEASFDTMRETAVGGAYQYDSGQRLRMHGLPTPQALLAAEGADGGGEPLVQAQYACRGDSQTQMRVARWDEESGTWLADVPDACLQRSEPVEVYVYVCVAGEDGAQRAKTMYEARFTPISRPAPGTQVTPEQVNAWDVLVSEVNLTITQMNAAISGANAAAQTAHEAAAQLGGMDARAHALPAGSDPTAQIMAQDGAMTLVIGVPQGERGETGLASVNGVTPDETGSITLSALDVGALSRVALWSLALPADGWSAEAPYTQTVAAEGMLESDAPDADVDMSGAAADTAADIAAAWSLIGRIDAGDGAVTAVCFEDRPEIDLTIRMKAVR